ncbi:hypothetical protein [Aestuariivivens sediminis]|uniref:hypothetical protein n=1 Tax=Aestuariivivens sediminis TaxID=2913557 RepID=UPI001F574B5B|nr:hypothetical protein [Aestuariivivens sediminis]
MTENKMITYFDQLGKLFYAIAAVDKKIKAEEIEALNELIEDYWADCDPVEGFNVRDPAYQIITMFEALQTQKKESEPMFSEFEDFYKSNMDLFTKNIKYTIILTANAIAEAVNKKNKAELGLLTKLKLLFNQNQ